MPCMWRAGLKIIECFFGMSLDNLINTKLNLSEFDARAGNIKTVMLIQFYKKIHFVYLQTSLCLLIHSSDFLVCVPGELGPVIIECAHSLATLCIQAASLEPKKGFKYSSGVLKSEGSLRHTTWSDGGEVGCNSVLTANLVC